MRRIIGYVEPFTGNLDLKIFSFRTNLEVPPKESTSFSSSSPTKSKIVVETVTDQRKQPTFGGSSVKA